MVYRIRYIDRNGTYQTATGSRATVQALADYIVRSRSGQVLQVGRV
jgi:hypothetical protein